MKELILNLETLWGGLPPTRRYLLAGVAVTIVAVLLTTIFLANRPNFTTLVASMPPEEAARIITFLKERKVPYQLENDGRSVKVPESQVAELRLQLVQAGIPRRDDSAGGVGFELFDKPTFGMSDFMQKANYFRALEGELARSIKEMDAVNGARVQLVVPEEHLFSKEKRQSKASVLVTLKPGREFGSKEVKVVRDLVANSVEGLDPAHVTVANTSGQPLSEDDDLNGISGMSNAQIRAKSEMEKYYQQQVQELLDTALGYGQSVVKINVDLDFDSVQLTSEHYDPKTATPRVETIQNEKTASRTDAINGVAGEKTNTEVRSSQEPGASTTSSSERNNETRNYDIDRTVETRSGSGDKLKRITGTVMVNVRKTGSGPTASVQVRTPQELEELNNSVRRVVGFDPARHDDISVVEMPFPEVVEKAEGIPESKTLGVPDRLLPLISQASLVVLALGLFFYLRSILKSSSDSEGDAAGEFTSLLGRYKKIADDALVEANRDKSPPPFLTADELSKLIRDNPSNTSQAIRVWLSRN